MNLDDPEFQNILVELTSYLKDSLNSYKPYRFIRYNLALNTGVKDKRIFRFHLDKIAIEILGKQTAFSEILIDERRIADEGELPTYPLYLGLYPANSN